VKQYILEHEHEELIRDEYIEGGHYQLWVQQGKVVGLTVDQMDNAVPLPATRAAMYTWAHMALTFPWLEAFSASAILERTNDNNLFEGGGHAAQAGRRWMKDLGLTWEEVPNFQVHRQADDAHNAGASSVLERHVRDNADIQRVETAARESLENYRVYFMGLALAMEAIPASS
jgi:pyrroloquinoline quinone (PQQ) biosynthesis protein C